MCIYALPISFIVRKTENNLFQYVLPASVQQFFGMNTT